MYKRQELALINFMVNLHTREHGYKFIMPPHLVTKETIDVYKRQPDNSVPYGKDENEMCIRDRL